MEKVIRSQILNSLIEEVATRAFPEGKPADWEFLLWRSVRQGLVSFWANKLPMFKDDVINLKRNAQLEEGWYFEGKFISLSEWMIRFRAWQQL